MKSILTKLALLQLLFLLLVGSLLYVLLERDSAAGLRGTFINEGQALAAKDSQDVEAALSQHTPGAIHALLVQQLKARKLEWAFLESPDGEVLAHSFGGEFPRGLLPMRNPGSMNWFDLPRTPGARCV